MKVISIALLLLLSLVVPSHTATAEGLGEQCPPNPSASDGWKIEKTYQFTHQGKAHKLIWWRSTDAGGYFCLVQGKTTKLVADKYLGDYYVDRIDRLSPQLFTFQTHDGNGTNVPFKKYRLDLSNPQQPKVTLLKQWRE